MNREVRGPESSSAPLRASSGGSPTAMAISLLVLLVISPIAFAIAVVSTFAVVRQVKRHWWEIALAGVIGTIAVALIEQFALGGLLNFHFGGYVAAIAGDGSWFSAMLRTAPMGIPAGVFAGAAFVGLSEHWAGGAEWHEMEQRRRTVNAHKENERVSKLLAEQVIESACSSPPLGIARDGDLRSWVQDPYVVVPTGQFPAMGVVGESGSGKTVTAERLVTIWASSGRKVFFCDFKGTDPELAERIMAAYLAVHPNAVTAQWPDQPLDMWRGGADEIINRLLHVQEYTEPYYKAIATNAINLVIKAPDVEFRGPVRSSMAFLECLNVDWLKRVWHGYPAELALIEDFAKDPKALAGVRHRYAGFFAAIHGRFDGSWSWEDVDVAILSAPAMLKPEDTQAAANMLLADFAAYCVARKPRIGEDVTLVIDEFSAVTPAAAQVIQIAERVRDVGGQVVVSVQSFEGLGRDDAERRRMRDALAPGGLIVHRLGDPDELLSRAGTVRAVEQSWQLDDKGATSLGTAKMAHKMKVDPDAVRQAGKGEAWVITEGRALHLSVLRTPIDDDMRRRARRLVRDSRHQARIDFEHGNEPTNRPWWDHRIPAPKRPQLESKGLLELGAGDGEPVTPRLAPVPAAPDPRILLAIAAYVRAGLIKHAQRLAEAQDHIIDPHGYVNKLVNKQESAQQEADDIRRRRRYSVRKKRKGRGSEAS